MSAADPIAAARGDIAIGIAASAALTVGITLGVLVVPLYDMHLFDRVLSSRSIDTLVLLSLAALAGMAIYMVLSAIRGVILATVAERVLDRLHGPVIAASLTGAVGGAQKASAGLADLQQLRRFFAGGTAAAPFDLLLSPALIGVLFLMHPGLGWFATAAALALLACAIATDALARPHLAAAEGRMRLALAETGTLLRDPVLADGLGMGPAIAGRWRQGQGRALAALAAATRRGESIEAAAKLVRVVMQGGMIALAALLVLRNEATPGVLVGANLILALLLMPLEQVMAHWRAVAAARLAWQRLAALLATPGLAHARTRESVSALEDGALDEGGIALRSVTFHPRTAERAVVAEVTLAVAPGEIVALTGPNGSGKSSLARLAAGVILPDSGSASVAGRPAAAAAEAGLVGYLPQRIQLLEATVSETIARFGAATADRLVAAARAADMHEVIGRLPQGYATEVGPLTPLLSGGQKQRLALARALFGDPPALVLDEPDAHLDHDGERVMAAALLAARARGAAVLLVTHRRPLLSIADRVLHVADGRIVAPKSAPVVEPVA